MGRADGAASKAPDEPAEVWEQQLDETDRAYAAFAHYRDTPPAQRSQRKTASTVGSSNVRVGRWSTAHGWMQRVRAYDLEIERVRLAEMRDEQIAAARRHAQTVQVHLLALGKLSAQVLERLNEDEQFLARLPDKVLIQLATGAARATPRLIVAERLALGLSSENIAGHDGGPLDAGDATDMSDAELDAFLAGAQAQADLKKTKTE